MSVNISSAGKDNWSDKLVQECLSSLGVSLLGDWDVLIFLYRHQFSLTSAEQISRLLGYPSQAVGESLDRLESRQLVQRSRSSQEVRLYQLVSSDALFSPESSFRRLLDIAETRAGRLLLVKHLRPSVGLHIAAKGRLSDRRQFRQDRG